MVKTRNPRISEVSKLLTVAVEANERAEQAHLQIAQLFRFDHPPDDALMDSVADAVADLHETSERDFPAKARTLVRTIIGRKLRE